MRATIIDAHCHLFTRMEYLVGLPVDEMIPLLDQAGIDRAVVFTLNGLFRDFVHSNDEIAQAVARYPDRLIGFGTVNPWYGQEAVAEVSRAARDLKLSGFKFHPWMTSFPFHSELMMPILDRIAGFNLPLIIHTGTPPWSAPLQIGEMAARYPSLIFILAHAGLMDLWPEAVAAAERWPNVWLETSGAPSAAIAVAVQRVGADRVVYGSDMPFGGKTNVFFQMQKIRDLGLNPDQEEQILGGNMRRLFGI